MRPFKLLLLLSIFLALASCREKKTAVQLHAAEPDTTAPILWTLDQSPITISETFTVEEFDSLIIEPGVTVRFAREVTLVIKGTLLSIGTSSDSIFLTSMDYVYWGGIHFLSTADTSRMEYTAVTSCLDQVLLVENSSPEISHCRLAHMEPTDADSGGTIIECIGTSTPLIQNCFIAGYHSYGACGVVCVPPSNARLVHNDIVGVRAANQTCVSEGGFLDSNYLAVWFWNKKGWILVPDESLGHPVDQIGDGLCTTISTDSLRLFSNVDGVMNPQSMPHYIFW